MGRMIPKEMKKENPFFIEYTVFCPLCIKKYVFGKYANSEGLDQPAKSHILKRYNWWCQGIARITESPKEEEMREKKM